MSTNQHIPLPITAPIDAVQQKHQDEEILVVKRTDFFAQDPAWTGLHRVDFSYYLERINQKKEFLPRASMELDQTYKQIIPYIIFTHHGRYFLMQRTAQATEKRLQNKYSLGIGGHIRKEDMTDNSLFSWAQREFHEEVSYTGTLDIKPFGILNDDSNDVGKVHIGFVFLVQGNSPDISVKSELKSGTLLTPSEIEPFFDNLESWSQIVFKALK